MPPSRRSIRCFISIPTAKNPDLAYTVRRRSNLRLTRVLRTFSKIIRKLELGLDNKYLHNGRKSDGGAPGGKKGRTSFEFTKPEEPTWLLGLFLRRLVLISPAHFLSFQGRISRCLSRLRLSRLRACRAVAGARGGFVGSRSKLLRPVEEHRRQSRRLALRRQNHATFEISQQALFIVVDVRGTNHSPRPLFLSYPQSFTLLLPMPIFGPFSVHSVQLGATRTQIRTVLPTFCGTPRHL